MSGEKLSLFTSIAVNKQPKTDKDSVLTQKITVITSDRMASGTIGEFTQLIKDFNTAGIAITKDSVTIRGDKVTILNKNSVALFASDGKLNASLIDADTITVNHLWAKSSQGGTSVGHFGNYDIDAAKISGVGYPLWLGSANASGANFRVSEKGELYSVAGTIGGFKIGSNFIGVQTPQDAVARLYLTNENLIFNGGKNRQTVIGVGQTGSTSGIDGSLVIRNTDATAKQSIYISQTGDYSYDNVGIFLDVSGSTFNTLEVGNSKLDAAIYAANGMFYGLRPRVRTITTSQKLSDTDNTLYCLNSNNDITLTLPTYPKRGQVYVIIQGGKKVNILASDKIYGKGAGGNYTWYSDSSSQISFLIYTGEVWRVNYMV